MWYLTRTKPTWHHIYFINFASVQACLLVTTHWPLVWSLVRVTFSLTESKTACLHVTRPCHILWHNANCQLPSTKHNLHVAVRKALLPTLSLCLTQAVLQLPVCGTMFKFLKTPHNLQRSNNAQVTRGTTYFATASSSLDFQWCKFGRIEFG